jgi:cell wall-associated protease
MEVFMFQFRNLSLAALLCSAPLAHSATVAIIDSGVDINHPDLVKKIWQNNQETVNLKDDDGNGYIDDINGWNFFGNSNQIIDLKYTDLYSPEIEEFFQVQDKFLLGTATEADIEWIKVKAQDADFVKAITLYGTFVHGTHVAGISAKDTPGTRLMTLRLVPVESPLAQMAKDLIAKQRARGEVSGFTKLLLKGTLGLLASAQGAAFEQVGAYIKSGKADVANASLGLGVVQARQIVGPLVKSAGGSESDTALIDELTKYFLDKVLDAQKKLATSSPSTLFVFASGNDGGDNDVFPVSPANAGLDNTMSVGASSDFDGIAFFSNYGKKSVDILAPGVGIVSSVPGNRRLSLTGTSQAAPYIAGVASAIKDANPALTPLQIKRIIMGTADIKPELASKVKSSGIVNRARALAAATSSKSLPLEAAVDAAKDAVADQPSTRRLYNVDRVRPMPLPLPFVATF